MMVVEAVILLAEEGPQSASIIDMVRLENELNTFSTITI